MMSDAITQFPTQFTYQPVLENARAMKKFDQLFFIGMGGSHLAVDIALCLNPLLPMTITSDYGLPAHLANAKRPLIIAGSYSGNTEETLDGYRLAQKQKLPLAVIASGGKLIELAKKDRVPFIELPNTGIQPRMALGFALRGLFKVIGDEKSLKESGKLAKILNPKSQKKQADSLAKQLLGKTPVIYTSARNQVIAYNWKIKFNETGKIPAFFNVLPELNHNEMNGFDVQPSIKSLCESFVFLLLTDKKDHPRIQKRMNILKQLYIERGLSVIEILIEGKTTLEKTFNSLLLADWTAVAIAEQYGLESEQVPMVEAFKKLMK